MSLSSQTLDFFVGFGTSFCVLILCPFVAVLILPSRNKINLPTAVPIMALGIAVYCVTGAILVRFLGVQSWVGLLALLFSLAAIGAAMWMSPRDNTRFAGYWDRVATWKILAIVAVLFAVVAANDIYIFLSQNWSDPTVDLRPGAVQS